MVGPRSVEGYFRAEIKVFSVKVYHFDTVVGLFVGAAGLYMDLVVISFCIMLNGMGICFIMYLVEKYKW